MSTPRLEIIHSRDPDDSCYFSFYLDGRVIKSDSTELRIDITSLDPGRGYDFNDWCQFAYGAIYGRDGVYSMPASAGAARELFEYYGDPSNGRYVNDWPEADARDEWIEHLEDTPDNRSWWETNIPGAWPFD